MSKFYNNMKPTTKANIFHTTTLKKQFQIRKKKNKLILHLSH